MRYKSLKFLFLLIVPLILSLACGITGIGTIANDNNLPDQLPVASSPPDQLPVDSSPPDQLPVASSPPDQQVVPTGFSETDCNVSGVTFNNVTVDYIVDDVYDGPYLVCSYSGEGTHGLSESAYFSVTAYKTGLLDKFYQEQQANIKGFVDQANEWNAQDDLPASAMDEVTFIRDDSDGYVFMITMDANVQKCLNGDGYGFEKINNKYLVQLQFSSCEGDSGAYLTTLENLRTAAMEAIQRVDASTQP